MIVVQPLDHFGVNRHGCWWLGERGDYFVFELIDNLLAEIRRRFPQSRGLYTCGRSMGGFGALLRGLRLCVGGIYAENPPINLYKTYGDPTVSPPHV